MPEKTEQPTPKKIRDSREKGQVAFSRDFSSMLVTVSAFAVMFATAHAFVGSASAMMHYIGNLYVHHSFHDALRMGAYFMAVEGIKLLLPFVLVVLIVGGVGNYIQVGPLFAGKAVKPDANRLNPVNNAKNIFSGKKLIETGFNTLKIVVLAVVLSRIIIHFLQDMVNATECGLPCVLLVFERSATWVVVFASMLFIAIAAIDLILKAKQYTKDLMMSKEEIKKEFKETEGDPHVKSRRRSLYQELAMNQVQQKVKTASVIVSNPTHIAVALHYESGKNPLPFVVAKGEDMMARVILRAAADAEIPIMQDVMLARSLYDKVEIGHYIPSELIESVAAVFRWLNSLKAEA